MVISYSAEKVLGTANEITTSMHLSVRSVVPYEDSCTEVLESAIEKGQSSLANHARIFLDSASSVLFCSMLNILCPKGCERSLDKP